MKIRTAVRTRFSASHKIDGDAICGRQHGHTWSVEVTVEGTYVDHQALSTAVRGVADELDLRDINSLVSSIIPNPEGVAAYFRERLLFEFSGIVEVRVWMDDIGGIVLA